MWIKMELEPQLNEFFRFFLDFFSNSMLKFFDELFNLVLKETEGIECPPRFENLPMTFPVFRINVGLAVVQIMEVTNSRVDRLFVGIKEKIADIGYLRAFLSKLGTKFLDGPAENTLYFLAVTSRIFVLMYKAKDHDLTPPSFIRNCIKALEDTSAGPDALKGFKDLPILVGDILRNENWKEKFGNLDCGEASDYFEE